MTLSSVKRESRADSPGGKAAVRATLADVAAKAGVHRATAGQVLSNWKNCWASEATRKRVREAADALGYRPNLAARALRLGKTQVIGLVSPGFFTYSPYSRADGLTEAAAKADYTVTLSSHPNDAESEDRVIRRLLDRGMDGLAIYPVDPGPHTELRRLVQAGFPVVTFEGANVLDFECDDISVDCEAVGRLQARHLLACGRRRMCLANMASLSRLSRVNVIREAAVRDELARAGAPAPLEMRLPAVDAREMPDAAALERPMRAFLEKHRGSFDGIIGADHTGVLAIRLLHELGLRIPEDVAVIGGGTTMLAEYCEVPMTSVNAENQVAGVKAFELLMDRIEGRANGRYRRLVNPAKLFVRKSTQDKEDRR
jgi:DNA-binding LacI/PurR family transcriptional regulator